MSQVRKLAVAGGTFSVALGIGFVMQNGDALAARMGGAVPPTSDAIELPVMPAVAEATVMPSLPDMVPHAEVVEAEFTVPADLETPALPQVVVEIAAGDGADVTAEEADAFTEIVLAPIDENFIGPLLPSQQRVQSMAATDCTASLSSLAMPAATVALSLSAPCAPNTGVTIHHQGMIFSVVTDAAGLANVTAPALSDTAVYIADIGGMEGAVSVVSVPDVAMYDRAVLQWQGEIGLEMHAREFGAGYEEEGHVWLAAARSAEAAMAGDGGYMMQLGDARMDGAMMAQVYTYPSGNSRMSGAIDLTVEAEVTATNCGREIAAQTIQITQGAEPLARDLDMTLPGCDAVGEFLVLNNMLTDLTLASR